MVCRLLGIGTCNAKQILKQLNRSVPLHCRTHRHVLRHLTCWYGPVPSTGMRNRKTLVNNRCWGMMVNGDEIVSSPPLACCYAWFQVLNVLCDARVVHMPPPCQMDYLFLCRFAFTEEEVQEAVRLSRLLVFPEETKTD